MNLKPSSPVVRPAAAFVLGTVFAVLMVASLNRGSAADARVQAIDQLEGTIGVGGPMRELIAEQLAASPVLDELGSAARTQQRHNMMITVGLSSVASVIVAVAGSALNHLSRESRSGSSEVVDSPG